jgi:hypothetical protein
MVTAKCHRPNEAEASTEAGRHLWGSRRTHVLVRVPLGLGIVDGRPVCLL